MKNVLIFEIVWEGSLSDQNYHIRHDQFNRISRYQESSL